MKVNIDISSEKLRLLYAFCVRVYFVWVRVCVCMYDYHIAVSV